ncbi:hypothetical protein DMENIID0001_037180 [Sergentomyia squamirostris]
MVYWRPNGRPRVLRDERRELMWWKCEEEDKRKKYVKLLSTRSAREASEREIMVHNLEVSVTSATSFDNLPVVRYIGCALEEQEKSQTHSEIACWAHKSARKKTLENSDDLSILFYASDQHYPSLPHLHLPWLPIMFRQQIKLIQEHQSGSKRLYPAFQQQQQTSHQMIQEMKVMMVVWDLMYSNIVL